MVLPLEQNSVNLVDMKAASLILIHFVLYSAVLAQTYQFNNGNWFIKGRFKKTTVYTVDGKFSFTSPPKVDSIIDLSNQFCIPPFGDAHTHNLDAPYNIKEMVKNYLADGICYVQVLGNYGSGAELIRPTLQKSGKLDVTYANGLLTATYGHGFYPYEPLAMGIYSPIEQKKLIDSIKKSRIAENNAYYFFDSIDDVEAKWPLVMKYKPDHIKICLLDAVNYEEKRKAEGFDDYGLSPAVAAYIVKKAHRAGLRVFAHAETVADAKLCAEIGVDVLAHLPGYGWNGDLTSSSKYCLQSADVKWIKQSGISIIPTHNILHVDEYKDNGELVLHPELVEPVLSYKKKILRALYQAKIPLGIGADYYGKTATVEIDSLLLQGVFTNKELLDIWCRQTAQMIFPGRKIGEIKQGYEASFLVLKNNPLVNFKQRQIQLRIKQGKILSL